MKEDLISIIVPIYNSEKTLSKCIDSVLNQTYLKFELILINDGSKDNSEKICISYQRKDQRIKYIYQKNSGVSSSRNLGIKIASGKWLMFLDSDDYLDYKCLESILFSIKDDTTLYGLPRRKFFKTNAYTIDDNFNGIITSNHFISDIINGKQIGVVWGYLFNADLAKKITFDINTYYLEDTLYLISYIKDNNIENIQCTNEKFYYNYFYNESGITKSSVNISKKCQAFIYSLDNINEKLEFKFNKKIELKKIRLLEEELRLVTNIKDYKLIINTINIGIYPIKKLRYFIFSLIYRNKHYFLLKLYYKIRKIIKKIVFLFKKKG